MNQNESRTGPGPGDEVVIRLKVGDARKLGMAMLAVLYNGDLKPPVQDEWDLVETYGQILRDKDPEWRL